MSETQVLPETPEIEPAQGETVLTLSRSPDSLLWQSGVDVEAEAFIERNYVETADELASEYKAYLPATIMLTAEKDGQVVGSGRIITNKPGIGFKTLNDAQKGLLVIDAESQKLINSIDPNQIIEIGTLSIRKDWRKMPGLQMGLNIEMYGAIHEIGRRLNAPYILASFDERYARRFARYFGSAVRALGPSTDYMGSPTVPVIMNMEEAYVDFQKRGMLDLVGVLDNARQKVEDERRPSNTRY